MVGDPSGSASRPRFQVRLGDLVMAVLGSGFVLDVTRRSRAAWGGGWPDGTHAMGLVVLALGVGFALVIGGQGVTKLRDPAQGPRFSRFWGLAWRASAVLWLAWLVSEGSEALEVDIATIRAGWISGQSAEMRLKLIPLMATLGMVGLVLASMPLPPRRAVGTDRAGRSWPSVIVATLGGLAILATGPGMFPYLVLLAMEAVRNALNRAPLVAHPPLFGQIARAGLEAVPALAVCLATAIWLDDDLKAAARDPILARSPRSRKETVFRSSTVVLTLLAAIYLVMVTIPRLSPQMAQGIAWMIDPTTVAIVGLSFGALAIGPAARSAARLAEAWEPVEVPARSARWAGIWLRRTLVGLAGLVALEVTASAVQAIRMDLEFHWYIPISLENWLMVIQAPARWIYAPSLWSSMNPIFDRPGDLLILVGAVWIPIRLVILMTGKTSDRPTPIDRVATDRLAFGRFLGWWASLSIVMVASLPIVAVVGVALTHFAIQWFGG